jgi:hypothetical protein
MARVEVKSTGPGRPQRYTASMTCKAAVRLNEEQRDAIGAWCVKNAVPVVTLLRESGMFKAGLIEKFEPSKEATPLGVTMVYPVKLTQAQNDGMMKFCVAKLGGMSIGPFMREAALEHIGRSDLGVAGKFASMQRQAGAFTA